MRLLTLDCTQVGHWTAPPQLNLSPRLTVVLGDNEAGKSTLRRAVRALLFGPDKALVAPLTVAGFDMGATLALDGAMYTIHRKGRNLQAVLPDGLAGMLSDANAGRFASLFDLTHDNLLPKDETFLKANGALGSLMFGARTGVSPASLQQARQHIDVALADADSRKQGKRGIPHYQEQLLEAKSRSDKLVRFGENDALHDQHLALVAQVDQLDAKLGQLEAESRRVRELVTGAEKVEQLTADRQSRDALVAEGPPPSVTKVAEFSLRLTRVEELAQILAAKREALQEAVDELDAAEVPGELHALVEQCDALRNVVASHTADVRILQEERQGHAQQGVVLMQVLERLGVASGKDPVSAARALLRPEPLAAQLRALVVKLGELQNGLQQKQALLAAARRSLEATAAKGDETADTNVDLLEAALPHLEQATEAEREIARLRKVQTDAIPACQRQQATLGFAGDVSGPDALRLPPADLAKQAEQALTAAQTAFQAAQAQWKRCDGELGTLQAHLTERRVRIGSVASADDVAEARALRDTRLDALCAGLDATGGTTPALPTLAGQAGELRALVRQSDLLVDHRMEAGEALGELRAGEQQAAQLSHQCDQARGEVEAAQSAVSQAQQAVAALWPFLPRPPVSAAEWLAQFESWRAACETRQQCERDLAQYSDTLGVARRDALAILGGSLRQLDALGSAQALHDEVVRERNARSIQASRIETRRKQRQEAQTAVAVAEDEAKSAEALLAVWKQQWEASTRELPDGVERQPVAIESWLGLQDALRRTLGEIDKLTEGMAVRSKEIAEKRQRIDALVRAASALERDFCVSEALEPAAAFAQVDAACKVSAKRFSYRESLARDHVQARREVESASTAYASTQAALLKDWTDAGIREACTGEALATMDERAKRVETLERQIAEAEAGLRGRWGNEMAAAIDELASSSVAVLEARLKDITAEFEQTKAERDTAADSRRDAKHTLDAMQQGHEATAVAQALADAREALFDKVEERFRVQVAKLILDHAHREASDGGHSIEEMASGYFRVLTGGAYSALRISDEDSGTPALVAVESIRNEKSLDALSAGTRDQIWLALRLAGVVAAARETQFPLLLDDSLVQFDDIRAKAGLQLLHEISGQVQVILFTHHDHVADLAEAAVPAGDLSITVLPGVSVSMRERAGRALRSQPRDRPVLPFVETGTRDAGTAVDDGRIQGRQRQNGGRAEAKQLIIQILSHASEPLGKAAILQTASAQGIEIESDWPLAIRELTDSGSVLQSGERKGARYSAAPVMNES